MKECALADLTDDPKWRLTQCMRLTMRSCHESSPAADVTELAAWQLQSRLVTADSVLHT